MRLIDADKLIEHITNTADLGGWIGEALQQIKQVAIKYINLAPSIDIVRCRECKYARNIEGEWICEHLSGMVGLNVLVKADDFCSYGERNDNGF